MIAYQFRHKPTGLFWKNTSGRKRKCINDKWVTLEGDTLSLKGKIWTHGKPSLHYLGFSHYYTHVTFYYKHQPIIATADDFELVEYNLT